MEARDDYNQVLIKQMMIKGKRTKRHRAQPHAPVSSLALSIAPSSSSSSGGGGGGGGGSGEFVLLNGVSTSLSDDQSAEVISRKVEEEDMANCLILLAQGGDRRDRHDHHYHHDDCGDGGDGVRNSEARQPNDVVYQCKTCNRCFPSFQALGGHRASHKKPKMQKMTPEEKKTLSFQVEDPDRFANSASIKTLSLQISSRGILGNGNNNKNNNSGANGDNNSNKAKVHECSICGAEFTSGQALGGHMRRHRATSFMTAPSATAFNEGTTSSSDHGRESKKRRNDLQLDLNLPAPDDDSRETKFPFSGKEQVIIFTASPLVDCYY